MKEKLLDKDTIDAYHSYVQSQIRSDLNSISLGPGKLPTRLAQGLTVFGFCCLLVGILLIALRMRHVYFWDWDVQFVGPFFIILFLLCLSGATYLVILASRRANRFRRELYVSVCQTRKLLSILFEIINMHSQFGVDHN